MTATRTRLNVLPLLLAAALAATPAGTGAAGQSFFAWQSAVGYEKLALTLGPATPVGAGVAISIVEAASGGNYFPLQSDPAFGAADDPLGQAVTFIDGSMSSTGVSDHANNVANWVVGNLLSLSKGANTVTMYNADMWLNNQLRMFKTPAQGQVPEVQPFKVQNHSWIGSFGSTTNDLLALRKFDFMIERDDVTAVVGLNNNPINLGATPPNTSLA
ncbi:MAG TPA: hypothetical protein PJ982_17245, partial [Lacipirellulaceae bacterium]|nr:hypothetical protein [Lacipirellulaceae bacterium]